MKKLCQSSVAFFLALGLSFSAYAYSDVDDSVFEKQAIDAFTVDGIVEGYSDGSFKPDQPINRVEALKIILKAFPKSDVTLSEVNFNDTFDDQWYIPFLKEGLGRGIIQGYPDGSFKPSNQVNFAESLKMGLFARGIPESDMNWYDFHPSVPDGVWYSDYFAYGFDKNLYDFELDGGLDPGKLMSRAEFVELIYRIRLFEPNAEFDISYNWKEAVSDSTDLKVSYPFHWSSYDLADGIFVGYFSGGNPNFVHLKPDNVRLAFAFWSNPKGLSANEYFESLKSGYNPSAEFTEGVAVDGPSMMVEVSSQNLIDYYVYLKDGRLLVGQAEYDGESLKAVDFVDEIKKVYSLVTFSDVKNFLNKDDKLEIVRANILASNKGQNSLDLFNEKDLIETDTIGVGTGPVDYYYIEEINFTLKYERSTDVILDIEEGRTSAF